MAGLPALLIAAGFVAMTLSAPAAAARNVLVLYSNGRLLPANIEVDRGLVEAFSARPDLAVELSGEFLDDPKFSGDAYEQTVVAYLHDKYAANPPDVIVVGAEEALDFTLRNRLRLFPQVPVVHLAVDSTYLHSIEPLPPDVIGTPVEQEFVGTIEQALRWQPGVRRVVVVTGSSAWDHKWEARLRSESAALAPRLTVEFLAGLPIGDLQQRLRALPVDSIVFTPGFFREASGRLYSPREAAQLIAAASAVPVYGPFSTFIGAGIVGGQMTDYDAIGRVGADTVIQLLAGAAPASVSRPESMPTPMHVDWRQVRRWGIPPAAIPADAVVRFREPTFWEAYRQWVILAGAVMLLQAGLIAGLLFERRRRRRTTVALAQSEAHMSLAAHAAGLTVWTLDAGAASARDAEPVSTGADASSDPLTDFRQTLARIHPQDRDRVKRILSEALAKGEEVEVEYRIAGPGGEPRWQAARGRVDHQHGRRLLGVAIDITLRKRAEAQAEEDHAKLRHMTRVSLLGQLSASIAHQLNQPLTAILGNAEAAQTMLESEPVDLPELREICNDIVAENHRAAAVIRRLGALFKRGERAAVMLNVNELVGDTLELMRSSLLTRHVAVVKHLAPDLPPIDGDRVQLQQMLLNLVMNAADAMDSVAEDGRVLTVTTGSQGDNVRLCVADRGPGIAPDAIDKMFEPFWSTKAEGMGIGLVVCRSIAIAHGGSLVATNVPDGGAEFCALLPASTSP